MSATAGLSTVGGCLSTLGESPVSVGFVLPFEGTYGLLGQSIANGFKMRVEQLQNQLGDREVVYHRGASAADPKQGAAATRTLLTEQDVDLVVGPISSAVAVEMAPIIDDEGSALWLNPNATNDLIVKDCMTKYHFRTCGSSWHYSAAMGPWTRRNIGGKAVLTFADYAAGRQHADNFKAGYTEAGGTVVDSVPVPLGTEDFTATLETVADIDADAIYSFFAGKDAINYVTQLHERGLTSEMTQMGAGFIVSADTLPAQGDAALEVISILNYTPWKQTPRNGEFVKNYHQRYGRLPSNGLDGYDCGSVADQAINEAGTDIEGMIDAIEGLVVDSPRGFLKLDADTHDTVQDMDIRRVVRGPEGNPINRVIDTIPRQKVPWGCNL